MMQTHTNKGCSNFEPFHEVIHSGSQYNGTFIQKDTLGPALSVLLAFNGEMSSSQRLKIH